MVVAKFEMDEGRKQVGLHVEGHAGADVPGNDIVCSAATILAYTIAQTLRVMYAQGKLKYQPRIKLKAGDAIISCRASDDDTYAEALHSFLVVQTGYTVLAHNYPQYVAVEQFGDGVNED